MSNVLKQFEEAINNGFVPDNPIVFNEGELLVDSLHLDMKNPTMKCKDLCGNYIVVTDWNVYPSYDFVFGYPPKDSPKYKLERVVLIHRKANGYKRSVYLDELEAEQWVRGIKTALEKSNKYRDDMI